jgi:hypothetical protein
LSSGLGTHSGLPGSSNQNYILVAEIVVTRSASAKWWWPDIGEQNSGCEN